MTSKAPTPTDAPLTPKIPKTLKHLKPRGQQTHKKRLTPTAPLDSRSLSRGSMAAMVWAAPGVAAGTLPRITASQRRNMARGIAVP